MDVSIFNGNFNKTLPDIGQRVEAGTKEVKASKMSLMSVATAYTEKYKDDVMEGTRKVQLLLEDGLKKGLSEEESIARGLTFYPTLRTPILNLLHFLTREYPDAANIDVLRLTEDRNKNVNELRQSHNNAYGSLQYGEEDEKSADKAPTMDNFIYGNMTHEVYKKIKKLKALSTSPNEAEAFAAYTKCIEMCKEFGLEFDKVKINN
jgi:hypothetical protein